MWHRWRYELCADATIYLQSMQKQTVKLCIVAHKAYGAVTGSNRGHIGGIEWQTNLIARCMATRGHHVSVITWQEDIVEDEIIDNIKIIKICRQDSGIPKLRFFHPRWTSLLRALRKADADVYYHCGAEAFTGQISHWCHANGRRFVFSVASDEDCELDSRFFRSRFEWWHYNYGVRLADVVITQSQQQASKLKKNYGKESIVIPMPCLPPHRYMSLDTLVRHDRVLWVGRVCEVKRPDRLLNVARHCPGIMFDFAGPFESNNYSDNIRYVAERTPNVIVHGRQSKEQLDILYRTASLLCCTSDVEGFPNTFIEAWSHGRPVVTTFDPDNIVSKNRLGIKVDTDLQIIKAIESMLENRLYLEELGNICRLYYIKKHTPESVIPQFESNVFNYHV